MIDAMRRSGSFSTANDGARTVAAIGGVLKASPDDFIVEEIPAYEPSGEGEHLYLLVEKRDATTSRVVDELRRRYRVSPKHIGIAGMKDRQAVSRQWVSIHDPARRIDDAEAAAIDLPWMRVLDACRHTNKLRRGHLQGNRFRITIREVSVAMAPLALRILRDMEATGVPNFFGDQRYGSRANNHVIGRALVLGRYEEVLDRMLGLTEPCDEDRADAPARRLYAEGRFDEALETMHRGAVAERKALAALKHGARGEAVIRSIGVRDREFWVSAMQSAIFDDVLRDRMERDEISTLLDGDVAYKHDNGALFDVGPEDRDASLQERLRAIEISPSGPLWGPAMKRARGAIAERELEALHRAGLTEEAFEAFSLAWKERGLGSRRSLRMPVRNVSVEAGADERGEHVTCIFDLPAGSFATVVMERLMKGTWSPPARW